MNLSMKFRLGCIFHGVVKLLFASVESIYLELTVDGSGLWTLKLEGAVCLDFSGFLICGSATPLA